MKRALVTTALLATLCTAPAGADPRFRLSYPNGVPRAEITGDWSNSYYTVRRASDVAGPFEQLGSADVLCMGPCYLDDYSAVGGRTYYYRFDLVLAQGGVATFGPYPATIAPERMRSVSAAVFPNPGRGPADVTLFVAGRPGATLGAEVALFDLGGRRVKTVFHGALNAGQTRVRWDGLDHEGRELRTGLYLLRLATWDGRVSVTRVARTR